MRRILAVMMALIGLSLITVDADAARRFGGGKSIGKQRESIQQAPKAPAQQATPNAASGPQPSGASRWLGPLAGLALGAGLASLFMNNGLAGGLGAILMLAALVAVGFFVFRALRGRTAQQPLQYAGAGPQDVTPRAESAFAGLGGNAAPHSVAATTAGPATSAGSARSLPPGFDAEGFVRHAKHNFTRMQAANDQKDLVTMSEFLTPELYREIEADVRAAGDTPQQTEVVSLDAEILDVATELGVYVVSVRFTGLMREAPGAQPEPFNETWHLEKPVSGSSGWLVAGIQQN
jgi:predicted lipid-binding transport protein (Tim44 family)